jgi:hypothetical protein
MTVSFMYLSNEKLINLFLYLSCFCVLSRSNPYSSKWFQFNFTFSIFRGGDGIQSIDTDSAVDTNQGAYEFTDNFFFKVL